MRCEGKIAVLGCVAALLFFPFAVDAGEAGISPEQQAKLEEIKSLREEISLLNLLNGLYLSREQLDRLIPLAEQAGRIRAEYATSLSGQAAGYVPDLAALRDSLYSPTGAGEEIKRKALQGEVKSELVPRGKSAEELGKLEDQARQILTDGQVAVIESFKPCLIPPRTLSDPVAVGQASTTEKEEDMLDLIRRMPVSLYAERRKIIADKIVQRGEREKGRMPDDVRAATINTYLKKLDEVRRMSEVDFGLKKKELAQSFQLFDDAVTYHKGRLRELGPISHHLLNARAAEVMKKWREARKNDPAQTELQAVIEANPADRRTKLYSLALMGYGGATRPLLEERSRSGKLAEQEKNSMRLALSQVKQIQPAAKQFEATETVADRLNSLGVTRASVDSMIAKIACLCVQKNVPGVIRPKAVPFPLFEDVTGFGAIVEKARQDGEAGRINEAYSALVKVAETLKQFRE